MFLINVFHKCGMCWKYVRHSDVYLEKGEWMVVSWKMNENVQITGLQFSQNASKMAKMWWFLVWWRIAWSYNNF